jgi:predicted HD phosphohydrolase
VEGRSSTSAPTPEEVKAFEEHPWSADAISLRRWDDAAKDPEGPVLPMDDLMAAYDRVMRA